MFGAYFGLAVSWMLGTPGKSAEAEGGHVSDIFSLIGTVFLWIYWPSFNAGPLEGDSAGQQRAVINTIISLTFSTVGAFFVSSLLSHTYKFRPVDIQNATLAGGVAIGAVADLTLNPADPALIGLAAGMLSAFGYAKILVFLEEKIHLHDTCGIHNLHAMPSVLGGVASVVLAAIKGTRMHDVPHPYHGRYQAGDQAIAIAFTLGTAISSGLIVGYVLTFLKPSTDFEAYSDTPYWEVMDDFGRTIKEEDLEKRLVRSIEEINEGISMAKELQKMMAKYNNLEPTDDDESDDADSDADTDGSVLKQKLSNLVPARHKASTMFGAGHAKSSLTSSRHGDSGVKFTGQKTLNSSIHGHDG